MIYLKFISLTNGAMIDAFLRPLRGESRPFQPADVTGEYLYRLGGDLSPPFKLASNTAMLV